MRMCNVWCTALFAVIFSIEAQKGHPALRCVELRAASFEYCWQTLCSSWPTIRAQGPPGTIDFVVPVVADLHVQEMTCTWWTAVDLDVQMAGSTHTCYLPAKGGAVSLVVEVSASRPGSLEFESRMRRWEFSLPKPVRIGAVKAFDPK